jgi:RND family efflux transporter MFP subunit
MSKTQTKRRRKSPLPRILLLILVASMAGGYFWLAAETADDEPEPETARVRRETLDRTISATGVIRPMVGAEINVGSRVSGIVRSIPVKVGATVARGDLLARIDPTEFLSQIDQALADLALADAQLATARSSHARSSTLASDGIVSQTELETALGDLEVARARVALAQARVSSAKILLDYTEIRAPIRGVIADVTTREGETVAASFASPTFVTIVDLDRLEVQAYVDETDIGQVFVGQPATFTVDTYSDAEFSGRVKAINPKARLQNGVVNYVVLLEFEGHDDCVLRPEMTAHALLLLEQRSDVLTLPRNTIKRREGRKFVTVQRDGLWVDQQIEDGWRTDNRVEIREGLEDGETVQFNLE